MQNYQQAQPMGYTQPSVQPLKQTEIQQQQVCVTGVYVSGTPQQQQNPGQTQNYYIPTDINSHFSQRIQCLNCNQIINTNINYEIGLGTWCMVLLFFCCFWPLMCLPCCLNSMKDVVHTCPNCQYLCGSKKYLC